MSTDASKPADTADPPSKATNNPAPPTPEATPGPEQNPAGKDASAASQNTGVPTTNASLPTPSPTPDRGRGPDDDDSGDKEQGPGSKRRDGKLIAATRSGKEIDSLNEQERNGVFPPEVTGKTADPPADTAPHASNSQEQDTKQDADMGGTNNKSKGDTFNSLSDFLKDTPPEHITLKNEKILAYQSIGRGERFFVLQYRGSGKLPLCLVQNVSDVGRRTAKSYLNSEGCVDIHDGPQLCHWLERDAAKYQGVLHVACKATQTRIRPRKESKGPKQPRMPPTHVFIKWDEKKTWITWSNLVSMLGRVDALYDISNYYLDRGVTVFPWDEEPKTKLKYDDDVVVEIKAEESELADVDPTAKIAAALYKLDKDDLLKLLNRTLAEKTTSSISSVAEQKFVDLTNTSVPEETSTNASVPMKTTQQQT